MESTSITVLNPIKDNRGNITSWKNTILKNVHAEIVSGDKESSIVVWEKNLTSYVCVPKAECNGNNTFSLDVGEYIVLGECSSTPNAGSPAKPFFRERGIELMQIIRVEKCLYGSKSLRHWEVTVK